MLHVKPRVEESKLSRTFQNAADWQRLQQEEPEVAREIVRKKLDELVQKAIAEEEKRAQELACAEQERLKEEQGGRPFQQEEGAAMEVARNKVQEWQQKAVEEKRTQEHARHATSEQGQKEETARVVAQKKVAKWLQNAASEQVGQKPAELAREEGEEKKKGHADADAEPEWRLGKR